MKQLTLATSLEIIDACLSHGRAIDAQPLTGVIMCVGGQVKAVASEDGSGLLRVPIATSKAWSALGMGFGTRELARRATEQRSFYDALVNLSPHPLVPAPGGVLILSKAHQIIGALGVSGDTSDVDEECAVVAIEARGLMSRPDSG